jgi:predicted Zn-dependent peptidase
VPSQLNLPPITKRTLSNGLPVWLIEAHEVPLVQVNFVVRAGAAEDPPAKAGTASMVAAMLDEGAGGRSALELADAVEFLGASLATAISFDAASVRLNAPVARLQEALPLLADVALRPSFPEMDLNRLRQERLTALLQARDDPASIANMSFARIVFGPGHRYGTGTAGTEATLKAMSIADLRTFHTTFYQPSNASLIVVGDVKAADALPALEQQFGGWKATTAVKHATVPVAPQPERRQISIVDKPGAAQSQIRIGWVGVPRSTPDYFPLLVLNTVLGGSFTSRLNQNLREEHGYAYGASSGFDMRLSAGPFVAAAGVQTDKTADALTEFFKELDGIRRPIGADELARAKNYIALGFPSEFETASDLARRLEELIVYGLPEDYFQKYVANVQAVTADAVQKAAAKYIAPDRFAVVVAGDRSAIEPGIHALNLGPVRVMSVDEALGP